MAYTKDDMKLDVEWLMGYGVTKKEAMEFIMNVVEQARQRARYEL